MIIVYTYCRLLIFLLSLSYKAAVSNCSLLSVWFWMKCQPLCHVAAHFKWCLYSYSLSFCFLIQKNLISWLNRQRTAACLALLPFILMFIKLGVSSLSLHVLLNQEFLSSKHFEQLRNTGIINSATRSHLVGYFYTICIMLDVSMNNINTTRSLFHIVRQQGNLWHFFKTSCIISVLYSTKCHLFHNFIFFFSNNT